MLRYALTMVVMLDWINGARAGETFILKDTPKILFLGDSNTFAGHFIAYVDAYLATRFPDKQYELINLGLPSETVSGLTEEDHPFPRPNVHERAERALTKTKPDVVVICYGMNDGIYAPFDEGRFAKYKAGIQSLLDKVKVAGAKPVLMTPAPFDPIPVRKNLRPLSASSFSYMTPYEDYADVLRRYSEWLVTLRAKGIPVADANAALRRFIADARKAAPKLNLSGDGIHPSPAGHAIIAREFLVALQAPAVVDEAVIDIGARKDVKGNLGGFKFSKETIQFTWKTRVPMPRDPRWPVEIIDRLGLPEAINRHQLRLIGAKVDYELWEGKTKLALISKRELTAGADLTRLSALSTNQSSAKIGKLMLDRHKLLDLAWLDFVGHTRPQTPKGMPLEDAKKKAAPLAEQIRELAQPREISFELRARP